LVAAVPEAKPVPTGGCHENDHEEAFVKTLQMHGIEHAFGIIGSAFMPISDLFPKAGITFWDCAHEGSGGMMADGYTRATGKMSMMIAQNGPGITNFVTAVKTAYWNHTPLLLVTPQAANKTIGQGGFQEVEQMKLFEDMVAYQEEVRDPSRVAEVLNRVILQGQARLGAGADQHAARFLDPGDRHRDARDRRVRTPLRRRNAVARPPSCCRAPSSR
jgi:2-succinyl-5-enolpyruvyl-6-hydroxy-3-cyclohexene-1-carboxylate synthase